MPYFNHFHLIFAPQLHVWRPLNSNGLFFDLHYHLALSLILPTFFLLQMLLQMLHLSLLASMKVPLFESTIRSVLMMINLIVNSLQTPADACS